MRTFACLIAVFLLPCWNATTCSAQQQPGPATFENLLNSPNDPPLKTPANDAEKPIPSVVPDEAAVKQAQDLIKQAYEDDYKTAAKNPEPLIRKLLAAAAQTKDPVRKYAYLISAEEAAVTGSDYGRTMELIDIRTREFVSDGLRERTGRLAEFLTPKVKTDPEVLARLYRHAIETAERGVKQDSLEQAKAAAEMAASIAKSLYMTGKAKKNDGVANDGEAKQAQARSLVKEIDRRAGLFAEYKKALEAIKEKEDPAANGVIGRYLCFAVGDWKKGMPFLAKGDPKDVAEVAAEELRVLAADQPDAKEVFSLAGKWWAAADAKDADELFREAVKQHAAGLYEFVWERLDDPLDKALAGKRARETGSPTGQTVKSSDPPRKQAGDHFVVEMKPLGFRSGTQEGHYSLDGKIPVDRFGKVDHGPIRLQGVLKPKSFCVIAPSRSFSQLTFEVPPQCTELLAEVAMADTSVGQRTPITFRVVALNGDVLWSSIPLEKAGQKQACRVRVDGHKAVTLRVECPGDWFNAHSIWVDPRFVK